MALTFEHGAFGIDTTTLSEANVAALVVHGGLLRRERRQVAALHIRLRLSTVQSKRHCPGACVSLLAATAFGPAGTCVSTVHIAMFSIARTSLLGWCSREYLSSLP